MTARAVDEVEVEVVVTIGLGEVITVQTEVVLVVGKDFSELQYSRKVLFIRCIMRERVCIIIYFCNVHALCQSMFFLVVLISCLRVTSLSVLVPFHE